MPYGGQQGTFFLGGMDADQRKFVLSLLKAARAAGYETCAEPCAGELAVSQLARQAGFSNIEASDVSVLSGILGRAAMGHSLSDMDIRYRRDGSEPESAASLLFEMKRAELLADAGTLYGEAIYRDLMARKGEATKAIEASLESLSGSLGAGFRYYDMDQMGHLRHVSGSRSTIVVNNPPTYRGGYEKQFRAIDRLVSWNAPEYGEFDPKTGYSDLLDMMDGAECLYLMREDVPAGKCIGTPIWGMESGRSGYMTYIVCNRPEEIDELLGRAAHSKGQKVAPGRWPLMPPEHEITRRSEIAVTKLPPECIRWYRRLWTHNFAPSEASTGYGIIIDGYLAGIYDYLRMFGMESAFIGFLMTTGSRYRLNRLAYKIAMTRESLAQEYSDLDLKYMDEVRTAMITRNQSLGEMRGIMRKIGKEPDSGRMGWKLTYAGPIEDVTYKKQLRWFIQNEEEYSERKGRA